MTTESTPSAVSGPAAELMEAFGAARNWRAIALTLGALLVIACLAAITGYLTFRLGLLGFAFSLLTVAAGVAGYSAIGAQLLAESKGAPLSLKDSVLVGLSTAPKLIGAVLAVFALLAALLIVLAIVLFICKIPYLGTALYAIVLPVASVVLGLAFFGTFNVSLAIVAPSVWDGNGIFASISRLLAVLRQRPIEVLIRLFLLGLMVALVAGVIGGVLMSGYVVVQGMAASMHVGMSDYSGVAGGMSFRQQGFAGNDLPYEMMGMGVSPMGLLFGMAPGGAGGMLGSAILFAIGGTIPTVVFIKGLCLIYLRLMADLDLSDSDALLKNSIEKATQKATHKTDESPAAPAAKPETNPNPAAPPAVTPLPAAPAQKLERKCKQCGATLGESDVFCGECGTRNDHS